MIQPRVPDHTHVLLAILEQDLPLQVLPAVEEAAEEEEEEEAAEVTEQQRQRKQVVHQRLELQRLHPQAAAEEEEEEGGEEEGEEVPVLLPELQPELHLRPVRIIGLSIADLTRFSCSYGYERWS